jgi:hypothetical protein
MATAARGQPSVRWQRWVENRPILSLVLVGIIATQLGTYFGYVFPAIGLPELPWPLFNGQLAAPATVLNESGEFVWGTSEQFFVGQSLHYINGIVFAILFGVLVRPLIGWTRTMGGNIRMGLLYGVIMTIISAGLLVPYAYVPDQGYGLFVFYGPDGWKLPAGILLWHLIYGLFLGLLYQPSDEGDEAAPTAQRVVEVQAAEAGQVGSQTGS